MRNVHSEWRMTGGRVLALKGTEILCKEGKENARSVISLAETGKKIARRYRRSSPTIGMVQTVDCIHVLRIKHLLNRMNRPYKYVF